MTGETQAPNDPRAQERYQVVAATIVYDTWTRRAVWIHANLYMPDATGFGRAAKLRSRTGSFSASEEAESAAQVHSTREKLRSNEVLGDEGLSEWTSRAPRQPTTAQEWPSLPPALGHIAQVILDSHNIVDREAEWDEEEVLSCCEDAWRRAMEILIAHATAVWRDRRIAVKVPTISAGPDGSIDLYWRAKPYGLLLNVPAEAGESPSYFGDDRQNPETNKTSGKLESGVTVDPGVLMWLAHVAGT